MKIGIYLVAALLGGGLALAACSDDAQTCDDCGAGASGGLGGSNTGGSNTGGSNTGGSNTGGSGGHTPTVCGGLAEDQCAATEFCDYQPSTCGGDDSTGLCELRPDGCTDEVQPVCGCDGNVHSNPCEAEAAGVDINTLGGCTPPDPSLFPCGPFFCDLATQYCQVTGSDIGGEDDSFACMDQPGCPTQLDCACLSTEPCGDQCAGDPATGFTLTCMGG